jgi:hypothetical protein
VGPDPALPACLFGNAGIGGAGAVLAQILAPYRPPLKRSLGDAPGHPACQPPGAGRVEGTEDGTRLAVAARFTIRRITEGSK